MEAVIIVDVLRRAGADVTVASVEPQLQIEASCGTKLVADTSISSCSDQIFDLVALPVSFSEPLSGFCLVSCSVGIGVNNQSEFRKQELVVHAHCT